MAKRKRLEMPTEAVSPDLEAKSAFPAPRARMPIAEVAGEVAGRAALEEVAREMTAAEEEGRVIKTLPLAAIEMHHLSRDRIVLDDDEMEALTASIAARGQQTPIEVVRLSGGKFGLISGLRRTEALRALGKTQVLALIRSPDSGQGAYLAMVEENEIRSNLSFYERANIAVAATGQGVFDSPKAAVKVLFAHTPKAKRSKILKFVALREAIGASLRFPTAIPEHLGLALVKAFEADAALAGRVVATLKAADPQDAAAERKALEAALKRPSGAGARKPEHIADGLMLEVKNGRAVVSGKAVDQALLNHLRDWLSAYSAKS